jgi:hypothetical protein
VGDFRILVIAGVLLLVNRYVLLAVAILAPLVNILTFHALMASSGCRWPFRGIAMDRDLHRSALAFSGLLVALSVASLSPGERS